MTQVPSTPILAMQLISLPIWLAVNFVRQYCQSCQFSAPFLAQYNFNCANKRGCPTEKPRAAAASLSSEALPGAETSDSRVPYRFGRPFPRAGHLIN